MTPQASEIHRLAMIADMGAVRAIDPSADDPRRRALLDTALKNGWCTLAERDQRVVGFAVMHRHFFSRPFLALLIVAEHTRRQGVAMRLVETCRSASGGELFTSTNESNRPAQRLFERLGFNLCGRIEGIDAGDPELIYRSPAL